MASSLLSPATANFHHHHHSLLTTTTNSQPHSIRFLSSCKCSTNHLVSSHRTSLLPPRDSNLWRGRCGATSPHPPPPPPPPPDSGEDQDSNSGSAASFSRFQESVQIFFAVLFWMSLFFWSSVWDGRNNGRSDKRPRFRK